MSKDSIFDKNGLYDFVVDRNIVLHREAIEAGKKILAKHWLGLQPKQSLQILDLACGGRPLIISACLESIAPLQCIYTGFDINPDQVASCRKFRFPKNVRMEKVEEGNIWLLDELVAEKKYDLIFMGLNAHHGTPEEIAFLSRAIYDHLKPGGIFLNHDVYRPARFSFSRRPGGKEFIPQERLAAAGISSPLSAAFAPGPGSDWREIWFAAHKPYLIREGLTIEAAEEVMRHIRENDFPISLPEMKWILEKAGLEVTLHDYLQSGHPIPDYYGMVVAVK